jgi:hypothetical protein
MSGRFTARSSPQTASMVPSRRDSDRCNHTSGSVDDRFRPAGPRAYPDAEGFRVCCVPGWRVAARKTKTISEFRRKTGISYQRLLIHAHGRPTNPARMPVDPRRVADIRTRQPPLQARAGTMTPTQIGPIAPMRATQQRGGGRCGQPPRVPHPAPHVGSASHKRACRARYHQRTASAGSISGIRPAPSAGFRPSSPRRAAAPAPPPAARRHW